MIQSIFHHHKAFPSLLWWFMKANKREASPKASLIFVSPIPSVTKICKVSILIRKFCYAESISIKFTRRQGTVFWIYSKIKYLFLSDTKAHMFRMKNFKLTIIESTGFIFIYSRVLYKEIKLSFMDFNSLKINSNK